jgi:hypothetical protein
MLHTIVISIMVTSCLGVNPSVRPAYALLKS